MDLENFPNSSSAKRMMSYITQGFYDRSYVGKWIFEVMGQEWDEVVEIFDSFPQQGFPQTCSWSLMYWEQKFGLEGKGTFDERKQALLQKITIFAPFTPAKIQQCIENLTGIDMDMIQVVEYPEEFRFEIKCRVAEDEVIDFITAKGFISDIKPAHLVMLFLAEAILNFEVKTKIISKLKLTSDFRALHHLLLDGTWFLDGNKFLDSTDLIESSILISSSLQKDISLDSEFLANTEVITTKTINIGTRTASNIVNQLADNLVFTTSSSHEVNANTQSNLRIEKDLWYLDGTEVLDGSRLLDAEIQEFVI
ncbi:MAG: DUF2313 domain-containing protein [Clostridiales bacterium]|nr:DUF2313 domain-containing protein [Clostridiales bacterium]